MASVTVEDRTWLVLLRDISHAVRIPDEPRVVGSLVFDMATGVILASAVAGHDEQVLQQACEMALVRPAGGLAPRRPDHVLCNPGLASVLKAQLGNMGLATPLPPISEVPVVHEAEDIFDSFVGHMAGRRDAEELAAPRDWQLLFDLLLHFYEREVWSRWADDVDLLVDVTIGPRSRQYTAVVLGHEGIQYGVVLHPGDRPPARLRGHSTRPPTLPEGTLMLNFDPSEDVPAEFAMKAARYGWPAASELVPIFLTVDGTQPGEPGKDDVNVLAVALAALLEHDAVGPTLVEVGPKVTSGKLELAEGEPASFRIRQLPRFEEDAGDSLQIHLAGTDLFPLGTLVVMGSTRTAGLRALRRAARIHRPLPATSPPITEGEVAMIIVITDEQEGDRLAGRLAAMDPYGISVAEVEGRAVMALVGSGGAELLAEVPASDPAVRKFRSRLKTRKGVHAVLIADAATATGAGNVYGLFECRLPASPPAGRRPGSTPARRPSTPRKRR
jgi:hypothetical protein